jgi:hypothetical protein
MNEIIERYNQIKKELLALQDSDSPAFMTLQQEKIDLDKQYPELMSRNPNPPQYTAAKLQELIDKKNREDYDREHPQH